MKIILVNGSPHQSDSTTRALLEVEKTLIEEGVEKPKTEKNSFHIFC